VLINPEIEPLTEEQVLGWEACLSVPGLNGAVPRYTHIRYRGVTPTGQPIEREATGFHARVVQHECDHLDGILYPMRMTDLSLLVFSEELRRFTQDNREVRDDHDDHEDRDDPADESDTAASA
jgi:peptide deformylase